jgi:hypothetical protein
MKKAIVWMVPALIALALSGCADHALPPPNSVQTWFDPLAQAVQLMVSQREPTMQAELVRADGVPVQVGSVTLVSAPHVYYNPPPFVSVGVGGCGFGRAALPPGGLPPGPTHEILLNESARPTNRPSAAKGGPGTNLYFTGIIRCSYGVPGHIT